jgi:predicted Rossmann-fold nucleotide-binding protein
VGTHFWQGLLDWINKNMVERGMINQEDMQLVQLIDEPANVIDAIFAFYEARDIVPSESGSHSHSLL